MKDPFAYENCANNDQNEKRTYKGLALDDTKVI